jgi:pilus assembly protein FimV
VTVKAGDTAGKIAARNKPANVSLDQMLVALLKSNPNAFINGNIHTMKSGSVLDIPDTETASATPSAEARQLIVAQSKDFNAFRRKLAEGASAATVDGVDRKASGNVQTQVEDKAPNASNPDKLTLSNGALKGKSATEDKIAKEKAAEETASRIAALDKNITDLTKLKAGPPQEASASASAATGAGISTTGLASAQSAAQEASAPASAASSPASAAMNAASKPASAASAAASKPTKAKVKTPPPPAESDTLDQINQIVEENTLPLLGTAGLLAMLGGFGFLRYRMKKNKKTKAALVDSTFLESRLQPDSFFGASGGNRINTNEANPSGSSMAYTPSQIDASGDVDPVAEADVYLAYGRDEQAEDILKEALTTYPTRVAIHAKLLEIYETRRDIKTFESVAAEAFKLTQGQGPEWAEIVERGLKLDPGNPLYRFSESTPAKSELDALSAATISSVLTAEPDLPQKFAASLSSGAMDMDFLLDDPPQVSAPVSAPAPIPAPAPMPAPVPTPVPPVPVAPQAASPATAIAPVSMFGGLDLGLDFDLEAAAPAPAPPAPPPVADTPPAAAIQELPPEIDLLGNGLDFTPEPFAPPKPAPVPAPVSAPAPAHDEGMMEFDLDAFSLEIATPAKTPAAAPAPSQEEEDPLEIKFLLAEEFRSLGDTDGARSLADEVLAKATGPLKIKVQSFLNAL